MKPAPRPDDGRNTDTDVLIVGYGPVGQVLAILLAEQGWRVAAVEQRPRPYPLPRAVTYDGYAARVLDAVGVSPALADISEPSQDYVVHNGEGRMLLRFPLNPHGHHGWPDSTSVYQPGLEAALAARAAQLPNLTVYRGRRAVDLTDLGTSVEVLTEDGTTAARYPMSAQWVVGCDGANSFVRDRLGIGMVDLGFSRDWMACDVVPHDLAAFPPGNLQIADPARPRVAVSAGPRHRRWEFMRMPGETLSRFDSVATAWRLLGLAGVTPDSGELVRYAVYRFAARNARRWRSGRVLLAGDAAHQMPPFAGQGMCTGIRDAANLAWKLDLVLGGVAGPDLLDSYEIECRTQAQRAIEMSVELGKLICVTDAAAAARRDAIMTAARADRATARAERPPGRGRTGAASAGPFGLPPEGLVHSRGDRSAVGPVPHGRVMRGARTGWFDDVVGRGLILLGSEAPRALLPPPLVDYVRGLGGHLVHVVPPGTDTGAGGDRVVDVDGVYLPWLASLGAVVALVRPDFYPFGAAADGTGLAEVVADLRNRLGAPGGHAAVPRAAVFS